MKGYIKPVVEVEEMEGIGIMVGSRDKNGKPGYGYGDNNHDHRHHKDNDDGNEDGGYALEMENVYIW